ncbi:MAG: hypothetical protein HUJ24_06460 [Rhodobacteraceae bacterium]|nr:hypothetical protein [Paracoccaceae bacterium]
MTEDRPFTPAVLLLFLSASLHLGLLLVPGPAGGATVIVSAGLLLVLVLGLRQNWRWVGYVAFLFALGSGIAALGLAVVGAGTQSQIAWAILGADWLAAAVLFATLWGPASSELDV